MGKNYYKRKRKGYKKSYNKSYSKGTSMVPRNRFSKSDVYFFKRTVSLPTIVVDPSGGDTSFGYSFNLGVLPNYTEFTTLYQKYRIVGVRVRFIPSVTEVIAVTVTGPPVLSNSMTPFYYVVDYNDSTPPSSVAQMLEYQNVKVTIPSSDKIRSIYFKPRAALAAYSGVTFTSYASDKGNWIDTNSPNVQYYGLKGYWPQSDRVSMGFRVLATIYLQCKYVK